MRRVRRKVGNKEKVFGCDLLEHLTATCQEVPQVLRCCSEFVEQNGIVDGIYRLSGVSSNIQKLRGEFESDGIPDLTKELFLQDIHCVSSLCKAYFRELPNPLLTYQLYDKFAEAVAIQLEDERLVKIRDVLKELPTQNYRTLEFLMCHLVKMASYSSETNMHARNLAIVWAPNLLRSKDIEASGFNGTAAFMEVRVQSIVVEFILTHVHQLFPDKGASSGRRKSLPSPTAASHPEGGLLMSTLPQPPAHFGNISPGDGPLRIRPYHAIIEGTDKRKGSLKGRKWMSIFNIGGRFHEPRRRNKHSTKEKDGPALRPARSMDSLRSPSYPNEGSRHPTQIPPSTQTGSDVGVSSGGIGGSEYAVTYRRGTGLVSGGGGTQGTYTALDPEGLGVTGKDTVLSRSPGVSSKAGRRAAMHITGPTMVTVPLHITSNLALGVLQGGGADRVIHRSREKNGGDRMDAKEGGEKVEKKQTAGTERKVKEVGEGDKNQEKAANREEIVLEEGNTGEERGAEKEEEEAVREDGGKPKMSTGGRCEREKRAKSQNSNTDDSEDVEGNDEYMDMKSLEPADIQQDGTQHGDNVFDASDILNSTELQEDDQELQEDDQELSGYVQDNFDFLDHMDSSSYQVIEFSVEPPGHSDDEYEFMEHALPPHRPAEHHPGPETLSSQTKLKPHRPLSIDICNRHTKTLSLPYMTSPISGQEECCSEEEEEAVDDDIADHEYSSEEDENMFVKSLPADFFLSNLCEFGPDADAEDSYSVNGGPEDPVQSKSDQHNTPPGEQPPAGGQEQDEDEEDKEGLEGEEIKQEEEEDAVQGGGSGATEEDVSVLGAAQCDSVELLPSSEASTHRGAESPLPENEDTDESSTLAADAPVDKGREDEEDEEDEAHDHHCVHPPCHTAEEFSSCVVEKKNEGDGDEIKDNTTDKEIEDTCEEAEGEECSSETAVDADMGLEIRESMWEEHSKVGSEEVADNKHEEKMEGGDEEQDEIWDELEEVICEVIEDVESDQAEMKDVGEGDEGEVHVAEVREEVEKIGEEETVEVEEEVMNKTNVILEIVEEQVETSEEKHLEMQSEEEETSSLSELEEAIQESIAVNEEVQDEEDQQKEDRAEKQLTLAPSVDESETQLKEVRSDAEESKEVCRCEERAVSPGGVGRRIVISKAPPLKIYQVKAVPVVPPKPQHCRITALNLRQQQRERKENTVKVPTGQEGEQGRDVEDEGREKERPGKEREWRRDGDESSARDTSRSSPLSMCFDEAVAIATMRREKEKECEKGKERQRDWVGGVQ